MGDKLEVAAVLSEILPFDSAPSLSVPHIHLVMS